MVDRGLIVVLVPTWGSQRPGTGAEGDGSDSIALVPAINTLSIIGPQLSTWRMRTGAHRP
jgi:hypothetical protein